MAETWDPVNFDKDMQALMVAKLPISESKIKGLKNNAMQFPKQSQDFVRSIERFLRTSPFDYKLAGMYVIDAISRNAHAIWRKKGDSEDGNVARQILERFESMFNSIDLAEIFRKCSEKDKGKLNKTVDIWGRSGIFSQEVINHLSKGLSGVPSPRNEVSSEFQSKGSVPTQDASALMATLASIAQGKFTSVTNPQPPTHGADIHATAANNFDDFDYGDDDDDTIPKNNKPNTGHELPPALANLLDTLKQNSPSVSHNSVPDNISRSPVPSSHDKPVYSDNGQSSVLPEDANHPMIPYQVEQTWNEPFRPSMPPSQPFSGAAPIPPQVAANVMNAYRPPMPQQAPIRPPNPTLMHGPPMPQASLLDHPAKKPPVQPAQEPVPKSFGNSIVFDDPTLPEGTIRVLTRTLFVGPLPDTMTKQQIRERFSEYGNVSSVVVHKTRNNLVNAFLKFDRRQALDHIKGTMSTFQLDKLTVKVNWASGFGPKTYFNYELGAAIVPLSAYTDIEKGYLKTGYYGGFQGTPFRDRATIEEPDVEYRPPQALEPVGEQTATAAPKGMKLGRLIPPPPQGLKRDLEPPINRGPPKRARDNLSENHAPRPMPPPGMPPHARPPPHMVNSPNGPMPMPWPPAPPGYNFHGHRPHGFRPPGFPSRRNDD